MALIFVFPNYVFEFFKWKLSLKTCGVHSTSRQSIQSFFAGIITGMLTPNMQGNFIGRIYYFDRKHQIPLISLTLIGNLAALLVTLVFGVIALYFLGNQSEIHLSPVWITAILSSIVLILTVYFHFEKLAFARKKWRWFERVSYLMEQHSTFRPLTILWSTCRYLIFTFQFTLLLHACGLPFSLEIFLSVSSIYFITTMIPSLLLGKFGVREGVSLTVLSDFSHLGGSILTASLLVWLINLALPTLIGLIICKKR